MSSMSMTSTRGFKYTRSFLRPIPARFCGDDERLRRVEEDMVEGAGSNRTGTVRGMDDDAMTTSCSWSISPSTTSCAAGDVGHVLAERRDRPPLALGSGSSDCPTFAAVPLRVPRPRRFPLSMNVAGRFGCISLRMRRRFGVRAGGCGGCGGCRRGGGEGSQRETQDSMSELRRSTAAAWRLSKTSVCSLCFFGGMPEGGS